MLSDFIGIRVNRAKKSGMVNITSSVNSRERSFIITSHHDLHPLLSFPTRRSSDLSDGVAGGTREDESGDTAARLLRERSEEHTSELQSLAYLVCRLLLEKKN